MSSQSTMISPEGVTPLPSTGAPPPAAAPARGHILPPGTVIHGRYAIERILGSGGMATVYLAHHIEIGARLAIKVLHEELSAVPMAAEHFLNEARGMSRIQHPHVVAVSDYGKLESGVPFMVMEYINGENLETVLEREGPLPWARVRIIARQICEALGAAHLQGVVHRDVKPHNCLRQEHMQFGDFIKVLDFGIAQVGEDAQKSGSRWANVPPSIVGTPDYMAPELGQGAEVDHRADIYSLGVTLFSLLTGRLPFEARDPWQQIEQHQHAEPPAPSAVAPPGVTLDPRIDRVILRALAKKPSDRYSSMASFAEAIEGIPLHRPSSLDIDQALPAQALPLPNAAAASSMAAGSRHQRWLRAAGVTAVGATVAILAVLQWNEGDAAPAPSPAVSAPLALPDADDPPRMPPAEAVAPPPPPFVHDDIPPPPSTPIADFPSNEETADGVSAAATVSGDPSPRTSKRTKSTKSRAKAQRKPTSSSKSRYTGPLRNPYE